MNNGVFRVILNKFVCFVWTIIFKKKEKLENEL